MKKLHTYTLQAWVLLLLGVFFTLLAAGAVLGFLAGSFRVGFVSLRDFAFHNFTDWAYDFCLKQAAKKENDV